MDPRQALETAEKVERQVRRRGQWHGWVWLVIGIATPLFLIGTDSDAISRPLQFWIAVAFMVLGAWLAVWEGRRRVMGREAMRVDKPYTYAYAATVVLFAVATIALEPTGMPPWRVFLALLPSIPCVIAAWRIFTR